jgi:hypothetical protein
MRIRTLLWSLPIAALSSLANAQVVVAPPVYAPPAPVYVAPPAPVYAPPVYAPPVYAPPVYAPPVYAPPPVYVAPHAYIRARVRWHLRRAAVVVAPPVIAAPPPAVYAPPPPTVYVAPPIYVEQPAEYAPPPAPPVYYAPPPPPAAPPPPVIVARPVVPPPWTSRFGLGVRGTGQVVNDSWNNLGIGGELLYRAGAHVVTELASEYQKNVNGPIERIDVPTTLGVRLHIGSPSWVVSPYFVLAAGLDVAWQDLHVATDTAYFFDGQLGGGLELRLGQHVAITADARFDGKKRLNSPEAAVAATTSVNGKPVAPLADQYGGQFRLGFAVYF